MTKKIENKKIARSAVTGQFVKKSYAIKHPNKTVMETIKSTKKK